jgi:ubiquinone/menaquinone biosynthesis C-methylase UbiE
MKYFFRKQGDHVFDWRGHRSLDSPLRRLIHPPDKLLGGYVVPGMTVVDAGCDTGLFTLAMARMVGPNGRVIAVDVQPEPLAMVEEKAERAGLISRVETWKCERDDVGGLPPCDFVLAFYMAHEVPDLDAYFGRMHQCLRQSGALFLIEPWFHVRRSHFNRELDAAARAGFTEEPGPAVMGSHSAILRKG